MGARERVLRDGTEASDDEELVAAILGTGGAGLPVRELARRLLRSTGGLRGLARLGGGALAREPGLGPAKAARLLAAVELGRRVVTRPLGAEEPLTSSRRVFEALGPRLVDAPEERFLVIAQDARKRPLRVLEVARGGPTSCPVPVPHVFRQLLAEAATSAIAVHNHPSGDPRPSEADHAITERLARGGALLGVPLVDHVIVAREGWFSFLDAGLLERREAG